MYHEVTEDIEKQVRANGKVAFETCINWKDIGNSVSSILHEAKYIPANGIHKKETVAKFVLTTTNGLDYIISSLKLVETCENPGQKILVYIMILERALREANDVLMKRVVVESLDHLIVEAFLEKKFRIIKTKLDVDKDIYIYSGVK